MTVRSPPLKKQRGVEAVPVVAAASSTTRP